MAAAVNMPKVQRSNRPAHNNHHHQNNNNHQRPSSADDSKLQNATGPGKKHSHGDIMMQIAKSETYAICIDGLPRAINQRDIEDSILVDFRSSILSVEMGQSAGELNGKAYVTVKTSDEQLAILKMDNQIVIFS